MRILVIRLDRIGDVVLSTPVIKSIRDAYPAAYIAFMVQPYAREIIEGNPYLDEVIVYDKEGAHRSFFSTIMFARRLGSKGFDTAMILHPTNRSHIIAFAAGIPNRIGFGRKMPFLLTVKIPDEKHMGIRHERDYTLDALKIIGIDSFDRTLYMPVKKEHEEYISRRLAGEAVKDTDTLVGIHPEASCPSKRWPAERFAALVDMLNAGFDVRIALISSAKSPSQADVLKGIVKSRVIDFSMATSVGQLAALLKRCRLFISNDSGPVHIAAAVGTPSVVLFGRKQPGLSPRRWGPTGRADIVIHRDAGCDECLAHDCVRDFKCLKAITVSDVFNAARAILSAASRMKVF